VGGVETSVLAMLASLRRAEPSLNVAVIAPEEDAFLAHVRRLGCDGTALPFPGPLATYGEVTASRGGAAQLMAALAAASYARRLRAALRSLAPDIVHAHGIKMQVLSRWAAPSRAALVWHAHDYVAGREASRRALRLASGRCVAVIANSRSVSEDFRAHVRADVPVSVVYNAVDLARFSPGGRALDLDALAGMPVAAHGTVRIGLPATFGRWKGQDVFLRALGRLSCEQPWRAYIIGGAVYQTHESQWSLDQLKSLTRELALSNRVGFTGLVDDMPAALRALDVAVHASTHPEPFGMAIAEAMACGRAVVVARAGGAAEIVHDGLDAVGYAPGDEVGLSAVLSRVTLNDELRVRLGVAARGTAVSAFDARRLGPELLAVYRAAA
jgi:glycosyltransferase involved in cell wall biosynthesis